MLIHFYQFVENLKNSPAKRNKIFLSTTILSLIINLGLWLFLYVFLTKIINANPDLDSLPLHYNVFFGIDLYGKWYQAFIMPGIGLIILILNTILSLLIYSKKNLASYFLNFTTLACQLILAIAGFFIILINL